MTELEVRKRLKELQKDCLSYRAELLEAYARNKELEKMNDRLREQLSKKDKVTKRG